MTTWVAVGTAKGLFVLKHEGSQPASAGWQLTGPYLSGLGSDDGISGAAPGPARACWRASPAPSTDPTSDAAWMKDGPGTRLGRGRLRGGRGAPRRGANLDPPPVGGLRRAGRWSCPGGPIPLGRGGRGLARIHRLTAHPTRADWLPGFGGMCLHTVLTDSRRPGRIIIGISSVGTLRSDDDGATWAIRNKGVTAPFEAEEPSTPTSPAPIAWCSTPLIPTTSFNRITPVSTVPSMLATAGNASRTACPRGSAFGMSVLAGSPATLFVVPLTSDEVRLPVEGKLRAYRSHDGGDSWEVSGVGYLPTTTAPCSARLLPPVQGDGSSVYFWHHQR